MWRIGLTLLALSLAVVPAGAQTAGVAVQVSNGKRMPTQKQLKTVLAPGAFVRDIFGWYKADPHCDLTSNPSRAIQIPTAMMTLYETVAASGMKNFVTLGFNNKGCGQVANSGARTFPNTPALRAEFAAYAVEVVRHVPAVGGISIWNEISGTWDGGYSNRAQQLTDYCLLANTVVREVRKVDNKIPIAIGASVGADIDDWFTDMFDKYGCIGKGDPTLWLDVHPYLSGRVLPGTHRLDWKFWRDNVAKIRADGISNPLIATEWGAGAANLWLRAHPAGNYMTAFQTQVLSQDPNWSAAIWFELLYDRKAPNAGLFDKSDLLTTFGSQYIGAFRK